MNNNEFGRVMPGPRPGWARAQLRHCRPETRSVS